MIVIISSLLRQANTYLPCCEFSMCLVTPEDGSCVPITSIACATVRCSKGYICKEQQVWCIRAPCYPIVGCVPILQGLLTPVVFIWRQKISSSLRIPHNFLWSLPSLTAPVYILKLAQAHLSYYMTWFGSFLSICRRNYYSYI
jgi:hypothetical protein